MNRKHIRRGIGIALFIAAVGMLVASAGVKYRVYDSAEDDPFAVFGTLTFQTISEADLVRDATFSGTLRRDDRLYSTYDRSQPRQKRACPT